jgi:hypothetical protein
MRERSEKMTIGQSRCEEGRTVNLLTNKHWVGIARSHKEGMTEGMQKDRFGGNRKMRRNMERGKEFGGEQSEMEMLHRWVTE